MTVYRCILPQWASAENNNLSKVLEGQFTESQLEEYNALGYNIYYLPNYPSQYEGGHVTGADINVFEYVFVDFDLKLGSYPSKDAFLEAVGNFPLEPTKVVDSGNGIHVYWKVTDLDAKSYLKLSRRLMRHLKTDEAVGQVYQLMRLPGTVNTKDPNEFKICELLLDTGKTYTCEEIDHVLAPITPQDEQHCQQHYDKTYNRTQHINIEEKLPVKFAKLLNDSTEVKEIWAGGVGDRSKGDYRLGHIMFAQGFSKDEAASVLVNSAKALERAPIHRINYAMNIIDKIWTYEQAPVKASIGLSRSVREILSKSSSDQLKGTRFPCWSYIDNTEHGFRLGQVVGLIAGSGVGKTAVALNMFEGFVKNNPDYDHLLIPLEQPARELAERWKVLCGDQVHLHDKVHIMDNYNDDGTFRHLSLTDIQNYIIEFQKTSGKKLGCVVIDHIGALKKKGKNGENQDLMEICHAMKPFAATTNTLLIMQSQAPREKAGIGDLELNKDAAYGTIYFESYCDYVITMWQPLKRCYFEGAPTVTAFKFCKIRHKHQGKDKIQEDVCYRLYFNPEIGRLRELTQIEEQSFDYFLSIATNKRKQDRKADLVTYTSVRWNEGEANGKTSSNKKLEPTG